MLDGFVASRKIVGFFDLAARGVFLDFFRFSLLGKEIRQEDESLYPPDSSTLNLDSAEMSPKNVVTDITAK